MFLQFMVLINMNKCYNKIQISNYKQEIIENFEIKSLVMDVIIATKIFQIK